MAADVEPVTQLKLQARPSSLTPEQTYWRTFKSPINLPSPTRHAITHIAQPSISLNSNHASFEYFLVSTGARIQLFSNRTRKLVKTITRFDDTAYSGEIRHDGRVLVAGDETGTVQVFDVNSRAILKTWKESKQAVHVTKWSPRETTALMSCGDDTTVRIYDLPTETSVTTFRGHQDYVRSGSYLPGQNNLLVSGGYDQTVRLWDPRIPKSAVMTFKHINSVEDVLCMPSGTSILAAADNQIAVLDIVAAKPIHLIQNHQKTVTSLCLASNGSRLISGGLDGHLKVFETTGWNVVAGSKYPSAILSLCVVTAGTSKEDRHVVVGMSSGQLSIKTRLSGEQKVKERERQKEMEALLAGKIEEHDKKMSKKRTRGWEMRLRGRDYTGEDADIVVEGNDRGKVKKLNKWQQELHRGRYKEALDVVLTGGDKMQVFTLLNELRYRSALRSSLENRTENSLKPIMNWVHKEMSHTTFVPLCVEVAMNIMDLYSKHLSQSQDLEKAMRKLHTRVRDEVDRAQQAGITRGMLELMAPEIIT